MDQLNKYLSKDSISKQDKEYINKIFARQQEHIKYLMGKLEESIDGSLEDIIKIIRSSHTSLDVILPRLKKGVPFRRSVWPEGTFIFRQAPATINSEIVPKMQSVPQPVKDILNGRFEDTRLNNIYYSNQLVIVNSSKLIQSYAPTAEDLFAEDWCEQL